MPEISNVGALVAAIDAIAPPEFAEPWDNTGLLLGLSEDPVSRVMLCIDLTDAVADEAIRREVDAIVAYHPPIFAPRTSLTDADPGGARLLGLARAGIAVHSPHTAADAAIGGVNDWLLERLGGVKGTAIRTARSIRPNERFKIVTFTPPEAAESIRCAISAAGGGRIGDYDQCSTTIDISATFRGGEGTNPVVGTAGHLERVAEVRLEVVCGASCLNDALAAVRRVHPYEEPPIEVHGLEPQPVPGVGTGRLGHLEPGATTVALIDRLRSGLGSDRFTFHDASSRRRHRLVGLCAGSGGELIDDAIDQGCTVFVTGELKHHDVLAAASRGCAVILAGHTNTERGWLKVLRKRLGKALPDVVFDLSRTDADPLRTG
ncbi:MAG: Nif3-like dinuclear metal center hexameric protein [Phycisphaerae bacterium]|nr:Nif3-like dinuclear metal center hexameric protein [Phycisphaerae bacterium]